MRTNQCSIFIERFGKSVPESYPGEVQRISVYVDDFNSIYAALSKAYAMAINELAEYETIGCRADVRTNEFSYSDYKVMHGTIKKGRKYEDDTASKYYDTDYELCKDYIWLYEHSTEVVELIKTAEKRDDMIIALKEKYNLSDYQIRKLSQIRMEMMTKEEYTRCLNKIEQIEVWREKKKNNKNNTFNTSDEGYQRDVRRRLAKARSTKEELDASFVIVDNYSDMIQIMENASDFHTFAENMNEKYGLSFKQCKYFQYMSINDFTRTAKEKKKVELEHLMEHISFLEEKV